MAKLSAHGRTEVCRLIRRNKDGEDVMAVMSDNVVLLKAVIFREDGSRHSSTWRKAGKIKPGHVESYIEKVQAKGYKPV